MFISANITEPRVLKFTNVRVCYNLLSTCKLIYLLVVVAFQRNELQDTSFHSLALLVKSCFTLKS